MHNCCQSVRVVSLLCLEDAVSLYSFSVSASYSLSARIPEPWKGGCDVHTLFRAEYSTVLWPVVGLCAGHHQLQTQVSPRSNQTLSKWWEVCVHPLPHTHRDFVWLELVAGLVYAGCHNCCQFMCAAPLLCSVNPVFLNSSTTPASNKKKAEPWWEWVGWGRVGCASVMYYMQSHLALPALGSLTFSVCWPAESEALLLMTALRTL